MSLYFTQTNGLNTESTKANHEGFQMKELTVIARDRIGLLADISEALAEKKVNISSVSVETAARTAIVRVLAENAAHGRKALEDAGFKVADAEAVMLKLPDRPGQLARISRKLADNGVAIENVMLVSRENNETLLAIKTSDYAKAGRLLKNL